jgi:hypothetical protein
LKTEPQTTVELGELILAIYDEAAQYSADPQEISHLATRTVEDILCHVPTPRSSRPLRVRN